MVSYLDVVDRSLGMLGGVLCDSNVRAASTMLDKMLSTSAGMQQVSSDFNTCTPLSLAKPLDTANFLSTVIGNFMGVVQYDAEIPGQPTIQQLCASMNNKTNTPYQNYVDISNGVIDFVVKNVVFK